MAEAMKSIKPEHMAKIMAVSGALQGAMARARAARAWVARNSALCAALLVLLLALLLRRWLARRSAHAAAADVLRRATAPAAEVRGSPAASFAALVLFSRRPAPLPRAQFEGLDATWS